MPRWRRRWMPGFLRQAVPLVGAGAERARQRAAEAVSAQGHGLPRGHGRAGPGGPGHPERASPEGSRLPDARRSAGTGAGPASLKPPAPPGRRKRGFSVCVRRASGRATPSLRPGGRARPSAGPCAARKARLGSSSEGSKPSPPPALPRKQLGVALRTGSGAGY